MSDTKQELEEMCKSIRDELEDPRTDILEWFQDEVLETQDVCYNGTREHLIDFDLLVAFDGPNYGPNIYVQPRSIEGFLGGDRVSISYHDNRLFDLMKEMYPPCR